MKKKQLLLFVLIFSGSSVFGQVDVYNWLKTNIEGKPLLFQNKPLKVLLDSLKPLGVPIVDYLAPAEVSTRVPDTIYSKYLTFYLAPGFRSAMPAHENSFSTIQMKDTLNTHVPYIIVEFSWPVAFLNKWYSYDREGLGSVKWNAKLELFWGQNYVKNVRVGEF